MTKIPTIQSEFTTAKRWFMKVRLDQLSEEKKYIKCVKWTKGYLYSTKENTALQIFEPDRQLSNGTVSIILQRGNSSLKLLSFNSCSLFVLFAFNQLADFNRIRCLLNNFFFFSVI